MAGDLTQAAMATWAAKDLPARLLADRKWLDEATKTIGDFWKRKNAQRQFDRKKLQEIT